MKPGGNYFSVSVALGLVGYQKKKKKKEIQLESIY